MGENPCSKERALGSVVRGCFHAESAGWKGRKSNLDPFDYWTGLGVSYTAREEGLRIYLLPSIVLLTCVLHQPVDKNANSEAFFLTKEENGQKYCHNFESSNSLMNIVTIISYVYSKGLEHHYTFLSYTPKLYISKALLFATCHTRSQISAGPLKRGEEAKFSRAPFLISRPPSPKKRRRIDLVAKSV